MRYHYDCFLWHPSEAPMTFCWGNKRKAIQECQRLLALNSALGRRLQKAKIEARPLATFRLSLRVPKCPVVWRGDSSQYRLAARKIV